MSSLVMLPFRVLTSTTVTAMIKGPLRTGVPSLFGAIGTEDTSGERVWIVAMEWPDHYAPLEDKAAKELQHLNRFQVDYKAGTGGMLYSGVRETTANRPDFLAVRQDQEVGVELTQLTLEGRVQADAQFVRVRRELMDHRPSLLHLEGHAVFVSFDTDDGRPPKGGVAIPKLQAALQAFQPVQIDSPELPERAPPGAVYEFDGGSVTATRLSGDPGTPFFRFMNWEVIFAQAVNVAQVKAWQQLQARVTDHDHPETTDLIVSAEAPVERGIAFPTDSLLAQAALEQALTTPLTAINIKLIYLHVWSTRSIFLIAPGKTGFDVVCGELPLSITPPLRSFVVA